jgi:hypothetical protein
MKKNTILQLIIIYVGLNAVYYGITNVIQSTVYYFNTPDSSGQYMLKYIAGYLLICLLGIVVTVRSGGISNFVADRSGLDDSLTVYSKPQQLLSILIVVTALGQIVTRLPYLGTSIIALFGNDAADTTPYSGNSLAFNFFAILFPCLMIIFCRQLTAYFSKNILLDEEDMVAHQDTVEIDATEKLEE